MRTAQHLADMRVGILGLGLMGGSLAMGLRGRCKALLGCDVDAETLARARRLRVVDVADSDPSTVAAADFLILAAPVRAALSLIERLPQLHPGRPFVLDLCSTKVETMRAMARLPARFDALGGHPMCGKETFGLRHADPTIFHGTAFVLTSLEHTSPVARKLAQELVQTLGAYPLWMDAVTHDGWAAATSHVPYLLACALTLTTPLEALPLIASGFLSTSRLAASEPGTMLDILSTNRENTLQALARFQDQIQDLTRKLSQNDLIGLRAHLQKSQNLHARFISGVNQRGES